MRQRENLEACQLTWFSRKRGDLVLRKVQNLQIGHASELTVSGSVHIQFVRQHTASGNWERRLPFRLRYLSLTKCEKEGDIAPSRSELYDSASLGPRQHDLYQEGHWTQEVLTSIPPSDPSLHPCETSPRLHPQFHRWLSCSDLGYHLHPDSSPKP